VRLAVLSCILLSPPAVAINAGRRLFGGDATRGCSRERRTRDLFVSNNGLEVGHGREPRGTGRGISGLGQIGSADEPQELAGIAHVFEHMLFQGDQAARRGSDRAGSGGLWWRDQRLDQPRRKPCTTWFLASRFFDAGLDILADTLQNASFDPAEFERERHVVLEEIKAGLDDPERQAGQGLFRAVFDQHPYGRPIIGTEATVGRLRREDLLLSFPSAT